MLEVFEEKRWLSLVVVAVISLNIGVTNSFGAWQNEIKDRFLLTQTQVEVVGSVLIVGYTSGLVGGLLLEHCGIRRTGFVTLTAVLAYVGLYVTLQHPECFNGDLYPVLVLLLAVGGLGEAINYIVSRTVSLQNYGSTYGARIGNMIGLFAVLSISFFSSGIFTVDTLAIVFAFVHLTSSICCIFFLRRTKDIGDKFNQPRSRNKKDGKNEIQKNKLKEGGTESDNEKTTLVQPEMTSANKEASRRTPSNEHQEKASRDDDVIKECSVYGDVTGWDLLKNVDFWLLGATFVVSTATDKSWISNQGTYLRSFRQEEHLHYVMSIAPWVSLLFQFIFALASDLCVKRVPRILFIICILLLKAPLLLIFMFQGDYIFVFYCTAFYVYVSFSVTFVICPVLVAEYFGLVYYGTTFGVLYIGEGCGSLIFRAIIGVLYDNHLTDPENHTCYGLKCFYGSTGLLFAVSSCLLGTSIALYVRQRRRESENK